MFAITAPLQPRQHSPGAPTNRRRARQWCFREHRADEHDDQLVLVGTCRYSAIVATPSSRATRRIDSAVNPSSSAISSAAFTMRSRDKTETTTVPIPGTEHQPVITQHRKRLARGGNCNAPFLLDLACRRHSISLGFSNSPVAIRDRRKSCAIFLLDISVLVHLTIECCKYTAFYFVYIVPLLQDGSLDTGGSTTPLTYEH